MRPIKLKMQAFGPYVKPVELDFENGLRGEKFFLITGATGAGKTSILDAICYALYNESSGGDRKKSDLCSAFVPFDDLTELEFTFSLGEKIYKVHRIYKRKIVEGNTKVETAAELFANGEFKFGKVTEVNGYLKERLGFTVDQFRQVVVLPQSQFAKFLRADNDKRADILNVIFNAELYKKIEDGLKSKFDEMKKLKGDLEKQHKDFLSDAQEVGKIAEPVDKEILSELIQNFGEKLKKSIDLLNKLKISMNKAISELSNGKSLEEKFLTSEIALKNFQEETKTLAEVMKNFDVAKIEFEKRLNEEPQRKVLTTKIDELRRHKQLIEELQNKVMELSDKETAEKSLREKISQIEKLLAKGKIRLEERKTQRESFKGAEGKFKTAEHNLEKSKDKQLKIKELERLKKELSALQKVFVAVKKEFDSVEKKLEDYRVKQSEGVAAKLAETLEDGKRCPVCGSVHHPYPKIAEEYIPADKDIKKLEELLKMKRASKENVEGSISEKKGEISKAEEELNKLADVLEMEEAQKIFDSAKSDMAKYNELDGRVNDGEKFIEDKDTELRIAQKDFSVISNESAILRGTVKTLQSQIPSEYLDAPKKILDDLTKNLDLKKNLDDAWQKAEEDFHELDKKKSNQEGKVKSAEIAKNEAAEKIKDQVKPNIAALEKIAQDNRNLYEKAVDEVADLKKDFARLKEISEKLEKLDEKLKIVKKNYDIWERLSSTACGVNNSKLSFTRYYLNAMFKNVIFEANERLYKMSGGRYQFQNMEGAKKYAKKAGLDLEIIDIYSGQVRPVESLSGGESFLASLSLALGLAAVVKNSAGGINLDTIFIDEGFGSLDSETLDFAMNSLTDLQKDGGRLVGIISHVEELKQRISTRLEVTKTKFGSTAKFI